MPSERLVERACPNCAVKLVTAVWLTRFDTCPVCYGKPVPEDYVSSVYEMDARDKAVIIQEDQTRLESRTALIGTGAGCTPADRQRRRRGCSLPAGSG